MAILDFAPRRLIVTGGFAAAISLAPVVAVFAGPGPAVGTPTAACPQGEHTDEFTSACVPYLVPLSRIPGDQASAPSESLDECLRRDQPNCVEQDAQDGNVQPGDTFPGPDIPPQQGS